MDMWEKKVVQCYTDPIICSYTEVSFWKGIVQEDKFIADFKPAILNLLLRPAGYMWPAIFYMRHVTHKL